LADGSKAILDRSHKLTLSLNLQEAQSRIQPFLFHIYIEIIALPFLEMKDSWTSFWEIRLELFKAQEQT
jgi:hypothetical protein